MPNGTQVYISSFARSEAEQLKEQLIAMLSHDSDRDALVESIPRLRQTLRWFTDTLHGVEIDIHECACCGNQATLRVRDKAQIESFLCDDQACAAQAQPRELYDLAAASWLVFCPPQPPSKRVRLTEDEENEKQQGEEEDLVEGYHYVDDDEENLIKVYDFAQPPQPAAKQAGFAEEKEQSDEDEDLIEGYDYVDDDEDAEEEEDVGDGYHENDLDDGYNGHW